MFKREGRKDEGCAVIFLPDSSIGSWSRKYYFLFQTELIVELGDYGSGCP